MQKLELERAKAQEFVVEQKWNSHETKLKALVASLQMCVNAYVKGTNNRNNKGKKIGLSLTFKQGTKQDYVTPKQEHKNENKNTRCAKQT
jgi:hypothetical protein